MSWPPDTFVQRTLEALTGDGMRVTIASPGAPRDLMAGVPGVEVRSVPAVEDRRLVMLLDLARAALTLGLRYPRRLLALLVRVSAPPRYRSRRARLWKKVDLLRTHVSLARFSPDVAHFEWESAAAYNLPLFGVWGCPVVMSCHGSGIYIDPHTPPGARRSGDVRTAFQEAAAVRCVCEAIRDEARGHGLDTAKAWVIRSGVDTDFFGRPTRRAPAVVFRVVAVGALRWMKGHAFALRAIRELADLGVEVELDIVGGGPEKERLRYAIQDLELHDVVRLHGAASPPGVRDALRRADALLQPSLSEGLPTVVLEAMACGLPVVVTDCGGAREAVDDGVHGMVVAPRDTAAMAAALLRLRRDRALRERMGRAGRGRVETSFKLRRQTDELLALYEHVAAGRNGSAA